MFITFYAIILITPILGGLLCLGAALFAWGMDDDLLAVRRTVRFFQSKPLTVYVAVLCALTGLSYFLIYWHTSCTWFGHVPLHEWQYRSHIIDGPYMNDLNIYMVRFHALHSNGFFTSGGDPFEYPPAMCLVYACMLKGGFQELRFYCAFFTLMFVPALVYGRYLALQGLTKVAAFGLVILSILFSYPVWVEMKTGNAEFYVALLVSVAIVAYLRERFYPAAILIGFAAALKFFPFVYFGLFLCRKQYRQIALGLLTLAASELAGLWLMSPNLRYSWNEVKAGLAVNRETMILVQSNTVTGIDHSLFGFLKQALVHLGEHDLIFSARTLSLYMVVVAAGGIALYFWRIVKLPLINQIAVLCVASILLPPTSLDYTLLHLYALWAILAILSVQSLVHGRLLPGGIWAMVCLAGLFAPESDLVYNGAIYGGQVKCLLLFALGFVVLRYPWPPLTLGLGRIQASA